MRPFTTLSLALGAQQQASKPGPAEWGGLIPIADWDAANALLSGADVLSVSNAIGGGVSLIGAGTSLPQYVASDSDFGGKPSLNVAADSLGRRLTFTALPLVDSGPICVAIVCKSGDLATNSNRYVFSMAAADVGIYHQEVNDRWIIYISDGAANMAISNDNPTLPSIVIAKSGGSGANQSLYVNSTTADATVATGAGALTYGAGTVGVYAPQPTNNVFAGNCTVARVIVWPFDLSAGQVTQSMTALKALYAIA